MQLFTDLMDLIKGSQVQLIEVIEGKQTAAERQGKWSIKELEQEITVLLTGSTELKQPSCTEDWSKISVYSQVCEGEIKRAVSQREQMEKDCVPAAGETDERTVRRSVMLS